MNKPFSFVVFQVKQVMSLCFLSCYILPVIEMLNHFFIYSHLIFAELARICVRFMHVLYQNNIVQAMNFMSVC